MSRAVAFIIPGYRNFPGKSEYQRIAEQFRAAGYEPQIFWPRWGRSISRSTRDFAEFFHEHKGDRNVILGFSFGAMMTLRFISSQTIDHAIVCSLSPYFTVDLPTIPRLWRWRLRSMNGKYWDFKRNWNFDKIASTVSTPIDMLYGVDEPVSVAVRSKALDAVASIETRLVAIESTPHNIAKPKYREAIDEVVERLRVGDEV